MARVMITCLESGKPIYTGMSFDEITFEPPMVKKLMQLLGSGI